MGEGVGNFDGFVEGCDEGKTLGWEVGFDAWIDVLRKLSVENAQKTKMKKSIGRSFCGVSSQIRPRGSLASELDVVERVEKGETSSQNREAYRLR